MFYESPQLVRYHKAMDVVKFIWIMNNCFKLIVFGREEEELSTDANYDVFENKR